MNDRSGREQGGEGKKNREMISESVEEKVKEAMNEARERENRKLNVILVNVPESEGESVDERKKGHLEQVGNIAGKITEVGRDDFRDPIRLGGEGNWKGE